MQEQAVIITPPERPLTKKEQRALKKEEKRKRKLKKDAEKAIKKAEKRNAKRPLSFSEEQVAAFWQPMLDKVAQLRKEYSDKPMTAKDAKKIRKDIEKEEKKAIKEQRQFEKEEKKRIEEGRLTMYEQFESYSFMEIEELLLHARTREEKAFYRSMLNLKLQIEQEKVIGEVLL